MKEVENLTTCLDVEQTVSTRFKMSLHSCIAFLRVVIVGLSALFKCNKKDIGNLKLNNIRAACFYIAITTGASFLSYVFLCILFKCDRNDRGNRFITREQFESFRSFSEYKSWFCQRYCRQDPPGMYVYKHLQNIKKNIKEYL
uniref:Uncharacterized protein n=1 Tax=Amphimedon queenslandica TaxID=400682 RepID=A0A1X7UK11_AMPQE